MAVVNRPVRRHRTHGIRNIAVCLDIAVHRKIPGDLSLGSSDGDFGPGNDLDIPVPFEMDLIPLVRIEGDLAFVQCDPVAPVIGGDHDNMIALFNDDAFRSGLWTRGKSVMLKILPVTDRFIGAAEGRKSFYCALNYLLQNSANHPIIPFMNYSKTLATAIITILLIVAGQVWANTCYSTAVSFKAVPHDQASTITLESSRVKEIKGNTMTYDLGKEVIFIQVDSSASRKFLKEVAAGRCSARQTVTIKPERKSPFNTRFKAVSGNR